VPVDPEKSQDQEDTNHTSNRRGHLSPLQEHFWRQALSHFLLRKRRYRFSSAGVLWQLLLRQLARLLLRSRAWLGSPFGACGCSTRSRVQGTGEYGFENMVENIYVSMLSFKLRSGACCYATAPIAVS
jgi:hypothetical protein